MLRLHYRTQDVLERIPPVTRAIRREPLRRAGLGCDNIHAHYRDQIGLREIATAATMPRFHFRRTSVTPTAAGARFEATLADARSCSRGSSTVAGAYHSGSFSRCSKAA